MSPKSTKSRAIEQVPVLEITERADVYSLWSSVPTNFGGPAKNWIRDGSYDECRTTAELLLGKQFKEILELF